MANTPLYFVWSALVNSHPISGRLHRAARFIIFWSAPSISQSLGGNQVRRFDEYEGGQLREERARAVTRDAGVRTCIAHATHVANVT